MKTEEEPTTGVEAEKSVNFFGVHRTHCCERHGCKYGDDDCPVELKQITQDYPCEWCVDVEDAERQIRRLKKEIRFVKKIQKKAN